MTVETTSEQSLRVRKRTGELVAFNHEKLRKSIRRAAVPKITDADVGDLVRLVFGALFPRADEGVVTTNQIAEAVLDQLKRRDHASHIRFALVQLGRRDRSSAEPGWIDADEVRSWLRREYPALEQWASPARLVSVVKRDRSVEPFSRTKLERSIGRAAKGRDSRDSIRDLATEVADRTLRELDVQPLVTTGQITAEVLRILRTEDQIAYLRYASATKDYVDEKDFEAEALLVRNYQLRRSRVKDQAPSEGRDHEKTEAARAPE